MNAGVHYFNYFLNGWWPIIITTLLTIIVGIRLYVAGKDCPSSCQIHGKIVLITGASGGIGLVTAKLLAARGAHIILTCRDIAKGKRAVEIIKKDNPNSVIVLKQLDVSLLWQVYEFVGNLEKEYDKVDIMINNAGIIFHPYACTTEGFELTFATNYLGPFALTHMMLPLLSKSVNGRIINVTAQAHFSAQIRLDNLNSENGYNYREAFGQTKLALLLFTRHLAKLLKFTKITVNAANPGLVRDTDHLRHSGMATSLPTKISVWPWLWLFMKTPRQGSQTMLYLAVEPHLSKVTGGYFSDCELKQPSLTACDNMLAKRLYDASCKMCKIDGEAIIEYLASTATEEEK